MAAFRSTVLAGTHESEAPGKDKSLGTRSGSRLSFHLPGDSLTSALPIPAAHASI
ncbi:MULTISPECIES: hypothetical protein [Streptomyces]|uniref:hypothetical protein n=1 Tax=Streptomyces TaxID=1883 RepID=UPI00131ADB40|nr:MULTISPECIES: hypothetical protein [Streptomyces]MDI5911611.1 hypothetical protein [Streptomyces sp. 12257]